MLIIHGLTRLLGLSRGVSTHAPSFERCMNHVHLIGRVGTDPKVYELKDGAGKLVSFRLATKSTRKITQPDGSIKKEDMTQWHSIVSSGEFMSNYVLEWVTKGSRISVSGAIRYSKRVLQDGSITYNTSITLQDLIFLSGGRKEEEQPVTNDTGPREDEDSSYYQ